MADSLLDPALVPTAFGLANTGAICYFNSLLQALSTCTHFGRAVRENMVYMSKTGTGAAMYNFMRAVELATSGEVGPDGKQFVVDPRHSAQICIALFKALGELRPGFRFGGGMEGASEAVHLLLDMMEPPSEIAATKEAVGEDAIAFAGQITNPITPTFSMRIVEQLWCENCHKAGRRRDDVPDHCQVGVVSYRRDTQYSYHLFPGTKGIATPTAFAKRLRSHSSVVDDYKCEVCVAKGEITGRVFRSYNMTRTPPVLQIVLPQYHAHVNHYYPSAFCFTSNKGTQLMYRLVAQVEHSGNMHGGHYWTRALRKGRDGSIVPTMLNDQSVGTSPPLAPNQAVYILFYHMVQELPAEA